MTALCNVSTAASVVVLRTTFVNTNAGTQIIAEWLAVREERRGAPIADDLPVLVEWFAKAPERERMRAPERRPAAPMPRLPSLRPHTAWRIRALAKLPGTGGFVRG